MNADKSQLLRRQVVGLAVINKDALFSFTIIIGFLYKSKIKEAGARIQCY